MTNLTQDSFYLGDKCFTSRLLLGTGKYRSVKEAEDSIIESSCEIVTVAIRRAQSARMTRDTNLLTRLVAKLQKKQSE